MRGELAEGDYAHLLSIDIDGQRARESLRLGPDAPYYLHLVLKKHARDEGALLLLKSLTRGGGEVWIEEGLPLLVYSLMDNELYTEAEKTCGDYLRKKKDPSLKMRKAYLESLYWQHRDSEVLRQLEERFSPLERSELPELLCLKVICSVMQLVGV